MGQTRRRCVGITQIERQEKPGELGIAEVIRGCTRRNARRPHLPVHTDPTLVVERCRGVD